MTPSLAATMFAEFLSIWSELEQAAWGTHKFGGGTAELYAYRFRGASPVLESRLGVSDDFRERTEVEANKDARNAFLAVLHAFVEVRKVKLRVDGKSLRAWARLNPTFEHRAHVEVVGWQK